MRQTILGYLGGPEVTTAALIVKEGSRASASSEGLALERCAAQPYRSAERAELKAERCRGRRPMGSGAAGRAMDGPRLLLLLLLLGVSAN